MSDGRVIKMVKETDSWGVSFFPLPYTRYSPAQLYTTNVTTPWTFTVLFSASGYSNTTHWPCQPSTLTPWQSGVKCAIAPLFFLHRNTSI